MCENRAGNPKNNFRSTLVISGAFGLFSKSVVRAVGGYRAGCIGEDMDLIVRLHRHMRRVKTPYAILFVPDPVCWTEAPANLSSQVAAPDAGTDAKVDRVGAKLHAEIARRFSRSSL